MSDSMVLSRRGFGCALLGAAAAPLVAQTARPLVPWMYMIYPLEQWLTDYERTLDAWEAGGVRGLVIGPLVFFKQVPRFDFTYARPGRSFLPLRRIRKSIRNTGWTRPPMLRVTQ